jgi:hypothetical protein
VDLTDPKDPTKVLFKAGERLPGFGLLRDDGSTACGNWIYSGVYPQAGNLLEADRRRRPERHGQPSAGASPGRPTAACCTTAPTSIRPPASRGMRSGP